MDLELDEDARMLSFVPGSGLKSHINIELRFSSCSLTYGKHTTLSHVQHCGLLWRSSGSHQLRLI